MAESLEKRFDDAMHELYGRIVRECGGRYHPTIFHEMLEKYGGLDTAHRLLRPDADSFVLLRARPLEFHPITAHIVPQTLRR